MDTSFWVETFSESMRRKRNRNKLYLRDAEVTSLDGGIYEITATIATQNRKTASNALYHNVFRPLSLFVFGRA